MREEIQKERRERVNTDTRRMHMGGVREWSSMS
jgi:hypothetical protein